MRYDISHHAAVLRPVRYLCLLLVLFIALGVPLTAQEANPVTHVVQPGENLYRISLAYGVSMDAIAAANNLYDVNMIYAGQPLVIPGANRLPAPLPDGALPSDPTDDSPGQSQAVPVAYLNGVPMAQFVVLPEGAIPRMQAVYDLGQVLGNDPQSVARVGDSITVSSSFLYPVGRGLYNLGAYGYLQDTVDYYAPSLRRVTVAASVGWAAFAALDPALTRTDCLPDEPPLLCEYRVIKPSIALIMFGTNDMGYRSLTDYRNDLIRIVDMTEARGIIPVLSTIPPRPGYADTVEAFNTVVREISATRHIPLWDYHLAMLSLPNLGLSPLDNLHPSTPPDGYERAADFQPENLIYGYVVRNLTALHVLYTIRQHLTHQPG